MELTNNSIFGGAKASQEAENILIIQDKRLCAPRGKKNLQVICTLEIWACEMERQKNKYIFLVSSAGSLAYSVKM